MPQKEIGFHWKKKPWFSCTVKSGEAPKEPLLEDEKAAKSRWHSTVQKPSEDEEREREISIVLCLLRAKIGEF